MKRGPGKGVAKDQMILEAFLNEFVIKPPVSGEAMFLKIGACGGLKLSLFSYRFPRKSKDFF